MPIPKTFAFLIVTLSVWPPSMTAQEASVAKGKTRDSITELAKEPPKPSSMDQNWLDLEGEEAVATPALLRMAKTPSESIAFLKTKLKPLKLDVEGLTKLLVKLDSEDEMTWKQAFEELEYLDPRLAIELQTLVENVTTEPLRTRFVEIVAGFPVGFVGEDKITLSGNGTEFYILKLSGGKRTWTIVGSITRMNLNLHISEKKKWIRARRAILLLEFFDTPESLAILQERASGHPEAGPTRDAISAEKRIEEKRKPKQSSTPSPTERGGRRPDEGEKPRP